jgi:tetratricopeptide (TPR) repeat protein
MVGVSDDDFRRYRHVMRELYLFHDAMLGRLLDLAGDDTTVLLVSDHGFHCDRLRPAHTAEPSEAQAAAWHRQYGVLALRGPGVLRDERVYGCTLPDVAPTVLHLFGLPAGRDMDGRPLVQAFAKPFRDVRTIATWEDAPNFGNGHAANLRRTMFESAAAVEQLVALGYLPAETAESRNAAAVAAAESKFNLAIVHSSHGRGRQAVALLQELTAAHPDERRYAVALAKAYANVGQHKNSLAVVTGLEEGGWRSAEGDLLAAAALFHEDRGDEALARLADAERRYPPSPALYSLIGHLHRARESWSDAAAAYEKALALDDDDAHAHNGLAQALLRAGDHERAAEHALRAVGLLFFFPQAHFHLGLALKGMGETDRAVRSLRLALTQAPGFADARRELHSLGHA